MKQKKALQLASVASMIDQFNMPNIQILIDLGYEVDVVADFTHPGNISDDRSRELRQKLHDMGVRIIDIAIPRSLNPKAVSSAYKKVKKLLLSEHYNLIHCHSPIGGVICRQAAIGERNKGTKVIYTAHGFHFYDGAPLKNWIVFYPIEKWYSRFTDVLITINKEDYNRAKTRFYAKKTVYIPGIGVDTDKFAPRNNCRKRIRKELGLDEAHLIILSVGELNVNKNHASVIKAIKGIPNLTYVIVGNGDRKAELKKIAKDNYVDLRLVGFRNDVADFYNAADVYVLPSLREGLNVSLMEAMACGLACACSRIRGNTDLIKDDDVLFRPDSIDEIKKAVETAIDKMSVLGQRNLKNIRSFNLTTVEKLVSDIYKVAIQ